ncbi:MAG: hypothetical protein HY811_07645 [Planctomycetes bacterium]|nr:hypothetical protein [Planctomycetota bacterium]
MIRIISLLIVIIVISGCMASYSASAKTPADMMPYATIAGENAELNADIWIDCGENKLGAYTLEVIYNPIIVEVSEITTSGENAFPGMPMSNPSTFKSGKTVIIGMYTGHDVPDGRLKIAHIKFAPVSKGTSPLKVMLQSIYDTAGNLFDATAIVSPDSLTVTK